MEYIWCYLMSRIGLSEIIFYLRLAGTGPLLGNFGGSEIFLEISLKLRGLKFVSQKMWGLKFNSQKNVRCEISIQNVGSEIFVRKFVGS